MKYPLKIEKTTIVSADGVNYPVSSLPSEFRYEIETWDIYKQDLRDAVLEYEKAEILVRAKQSHIEQMLASYIMKKEPQSTQELET